MGGGSARLPVAHSTRSARGGERPERLWDNDAIHGASTQIVGFDEFYELVGLSAQRRREAALQDYAEGLVAARAPH